MQYDSIHGKLPVQMNKTKDGLWIEKSKLTNYVIPTFTKKIFECIKHNL